MSDQDAAAEVTSEVPVAVAGSPPSSRSSGLAWSALLKRVFAIDVLRCDKCGGPRRIVGVYTGGERLHLQQRLTVEAGIRQEIRHQAALRYARGRALRAFRAAISVRSWPKACPIIGLFQGVRLANRTGVS